MTHYVPERAYSPKRAHVKALVYACSGEKVALVRLHKFSFLETTENEPHCRKEREQRVSCDLAGKIQLIRRVQVKMKVWQSSGCCTARVPTTTVLCAPHHPLCWL